MSRFEEVVNEAIDTVVLGEALRAEGLAAHIAEQRPRAPGRPPRRGEDRGPLPRDRPGPRLRPSHPGALHPLRHRRLLRTRHPHPHRRRGPGHDRLPLRPGPGRGRRPRSASPIRASTPRTSTGSSTRSRSRPTTSAASAPSTSAAPRTSDVDIDARRLLRIVESSMSSEIYELMKRPDERAVVEKAHANPRFVEDCVREMIRQVTEVFPDLRNGAFVHARQENLETIHRHNVVAERYGLLSEIVGELESGDALPPPHHHAGVARGTNDIASPALWRRRTALGAFGAPRRAVEAAEAEEVVDPADHRHRHRCIDQQIDAERRRVERDQADDRRDLEGSSSPCRASSPGSPPPVRRRPSAAR